MRAPLKSGKSSASASSSGKSSFYLRSRTKILLLAVCLALMIGASVYSVLQPLNAGAGESGKVARWLWYPRETNPYARLQAVHCPPDKSNDYACRLNSVAVRGTDNLPEVWAVGNFGLVLHRKSGETKWEQLSITAKEFSASSA